MKFREFFSAMSGGYSLPAPFSSGFMPERFNALATYNAECARGIVHEKEWDKRMAEVQREFDGRMTPKQGFVV